MIGRLIFSFISSIVCMVIADETLSYSTRVQIKTFLKDNLGSNWFLITFIILSLLIYGVIEQAEENKRAREKADDFNWEVKKEIELGRIRNQQRIEHLTSVAQIQIQSSQYLMSLYEKAKQRNNNDDIDGAKKVLDDLERELKL